MYRSPVAGAQGKAHCVYMTAIYVAGIVAYWALLLVVVRRKAPEGA